MRTARASYVPSLRGVLLSTASLAMLASLTACVASKPADSTESAPSTESLDYYLPTYDSSDADRVAEQREIEELIAGCMQAQGFEYEPVDWEALAEAHNPAAEDDSETDTEKSGTREWVAVHGYGMTEHLFTRGTVGYTNPNPAGGWDSLTYEEQHAWSMAMDGAIGQCFGDTGCEERVEAQSTGDLRADLGCEGWARREQGLESGVTQLRETFDELLSATNDLFTSIQTGDIATRAAHDWAACMADAGFPGQHNPQLTALLYQAPGGLDFESSDEEIAAGVEAEIAFALTDYDCREATDWTAAKDAARRQAEEQFVAEHRAELEELKAMAQTFAQDD